MNANASATNCHVKAWQLHHAEIRAFFRSRAGSVSEADDLLQEVFLKVLLEGETFCQLDNARAWLFRVAKNLLIDRQRRARTQDFALPMVDTILDDAPSEPVSSLDPIDLLSHCLPGGLAKLSAQDREAVLLCDMQGTPLSNYAIQVGLSLPAAKSRLQRARRRLRSRLARACHVSYDNEGKVCCFVARPPTAAREAG